MSKHFHATVYALLIVYAFGATWLVWQYGKMVDEVQQAALSCLVQPKE
jgi:hypothetical protein